MKLEIDITCPSCNCKFKQQASNMKPGNTCVCPKCGQTIEFTGDDLSKIEKDINKSIDDLTKSFNDIAKGKLLM